jgi:outer membrane immunogenic protein
MKKTVLLASVSAIALFIAADVYAADLAPRPFVKAPVAVPAPVYSWTGCYVGAHVGWGWGRNNHSQTGSHNSNGQPSFSGSASGRVDSSGGLFGGQLGCNYQFAGNWVIGAQGDIAAADINGRVQDALAIALGGPGSSDSTIAIKSDWLASITGRIGIAAYDNQALFYAKGGAAWIHNQWDLHDAFNYYSPNIVSETRTGWTVGGGVEWKWTQNWTSFVEYNYYSFGGGGVLSSNTFNINPNTNLPNAFTSGSQQISTVKVGVNYLFGAAQAPLVARY